MTINKYLIPVFFVSIFCISNPVIAATDINVSGVYRKSIRLSEYSQMSDEDRYWFEKEAHAEAVKYGDKLGEETCSRFDEALDYLTDIDVNCKTLLKEFEALAFCRVRIWGRCN
ncbi:MAG: hypothetical protein KDD25_07895 [Bdellovibrionales bacterium]|nr:hypothetical protein [Bdellovibrionales bacterium]